MTIVHIASPYSGYANPQDAVAVQVDTFAILRDLGYQPIAPLLSHYINERHPASYERWMEWCLAMVGVCDVLLRLPGESVGADREVAEAQRLGKPVVFSIDELQNSGTYYEVVCRMPPYKDLSDIDAVESESLDYFGISTGELNRIEASGDIATYYEVTGDAPYGDLAKIAAQGKQNLLEFFGVSTDELSRYELIIDEIRTIAGDATDAPYTWKDFRSEYMTQFEQWVAALPVRGEQQPTHAWAEHQAANQAAIDEMAAMMGAKRE